MNHVKHPLFLLTYPSHKSVNTKRQDKDEYGDRKFQRKSLVYPSVTYVMAPNNQRDTTSTLYAMQLETSMLISGLAATTPIAPMICLSIWGTSSINSAKSQIGVANEVKKAKAFTPIHFAFRIAYLKAITTACKPTLGYPSQRRRVQSEQNIRSSKPSFGVVASLGETRDFGGMESPSSPQWQGRGINKFCQILISYF